MEIVFLVILFLLMAFALGSGFPVAFSLPGAAIVTIALAAGTGALFAGDASAYFAHGDAIQWLSAGVTNFRGVYWEAERDTLIAIPLFIFMGIMLQRSKIAEDLLVTMAQLFGPVPGGLGLSVVFVGALLAATTGIVGATVVAMGLISLPAMLRSGYSQPLATGTIAASGTLGQIIPPSIVLIILADQLASAVDQAGTTRTNEYKAATGELTMPTDFGIESTSAGDMFLGALVPGLVLVGLYMLYILVFAILRPKLAPAIPYDGARDARFWGKVLLILVPPLALIFIVLGSIIAGIATVNQAGAIGAVGAMIMAGYRLSEGARFQYVPAIIAVLSLVLIGVVLSNYDTNIRSIDTSEDVLGVTLAVLAVIALVGAVLWSGLRVNRIDDTLKGVMVETAKTTALVFIILLGAAMLTAGFRAFGGEELVRDFLNSLPGGFWSQFVIVMMVIFVLGFFLDFIEIAVVVVPIVAPILLADPGANVTAVWLGVMIGLNIQTSFLTPPFGFALFYLRGVAPAAVRTIAMYKGVIPFITLQIIALVIVGLYPPLVNYLPKRVSFTSETSPPPSNPRLQVCLEHYVDDYWNAGGTSETEAAIAAARGLDLSMVPSKLKKAFEGGLDKADQAIPLMRDMQAKANAIGVAAVEYRPVHQVTRSLERQISILEASKRKPSADADAVDAEIASLRSQIPANWDDVHGKFEEVTGAETKARNLYRRNADDAYEPLQKLTEVIASADILASKRELLAGLEAEVRSMKPKDASERIKDVTKELNDAENVSAIKKFLSNSRKSLRRNPDVDKAVGEIRKALTLLDKEVAWRNKAESALLPGLESYRAAIAETIGLRSQPKMTTEAALYAAGCTARHRDISLYF